MSDPAVSAYLTKVLCANGGRLPLLQIPQHLSLSRSQIASLLAEERSRFLVLEPGQDCVDEALVLPLTMVRICNGYLREECQACHRLHLCRFFLLGRCRGNRNRCKFSHDINSECNRSVLKASQISGLNEEELRVLLLQNDPSFLPEICPKYKGSEQAESCSEGQSCSKLHVCRHGTRGQCRFLKCRRSHNLLDPIVVKMLEVRGLTREVIQNIQLLCDYRNRETCTEWTEKDPIKRKSPPKKCFPTKTKNWEKKEDPTENKEREEKKHSTCTQEKKEKGSTQNTELLEDNLKGEAESASDDAVEEPRRVRQVAATRRRRRKRTGRSQSEKPHCCQEEEQEQLWLDAARTALLRLEGGSGAEQVDCTQRSTSRMGRSQTRRVVLPLGEEQAIAAPRSLTPACQSDRERGRNRYRETFIPSRTGGSGEVTVVEPTSNDIFRDTLNTLASQVQQLHTTMPQTSKPSVPIPVNPFQGPLHTTMPQTSKPSVPIPVTPVQGPLHTTMPQTSKPSVPIPVTPVQGPLYTTMSLSSRPPVPAQVSPVQGPLQNTRRPETRHSIQISVDLDQRISASRIPEINKFSASAVPPHASLTKPAGPEETDSSDEICLFHLWRFCKNADKCPQMHFYLPYRWQILEGTVWTDLSRMEDIEKAYCNPNVSLGTQNIDFEKMTCAFTPVRRLSTASSVTKPAKYQLTTEWLWYWKDEHGHWTEYGKQAGNSKMSSLNSFGLENVYLADKNAIVPFQAGSQSYEINFADMVQKNLVYLTKREIRRRPKFLSYENVLEIKLSSKSDDKQLTSSSTPVPPNWDKTALPEVGYMVIEISNTSSEYKGIQNLFEKTMSGYSVQKIKRIQNPSLWQVFQWQKEQMKKLNGGKDVLEKLLFHGTDTSHVDAICQNNFDWRICGINGTMYGKGSYFARDASYSHNYCKSIRSTKSIFVARVLVGDFVQGAANYVRPPNKSFKSNSFYDSCVDQVLDPSIFVIFERHQIYPEYILEYVEDKKCSIS